MSSQNSEYAKLLDYLDFHKKQSNGSGPKSKVSAPNNSSDLSSGDANNTKSDILQETKKLIEDSIKDVHSDVEIKAHAKYSVGFDVEKFESFMRAKLVDEFKRLQSYERPYISVTELLKCMRQNYYYRMKYPLDIKQQYSFAYLYLINKIGNEVHNIIQDLYNFSEVEKTIVSDTYGVKGRIDGIKENVITEIKTIDEDKFNEKLRESDYHQGIIYAHILNNEYNYNIDTITVVYVIRNLKRIIPFDVEVNHELAISYLKRGPVLKNCIAGKEIPEPVGSTKEQCQYCPYKKICEKDKSSMQKPFEEKSKTKQKKKSVFLIS